MAAALGSTTWKSASALIAVADISPALLGFWQRRLGFNVAVTVPHPPTADKDTAPVGFAILVRDGLSVMLQSTAALEADLPGCFTAPASNGAVYVKLEGLDSCRRALGLVPKGGDKEGWELSPEGRAESTAEGWSVPVAARTTFYGAHETWVKAPCGTTIGLSEHPPQPKSDSSDTAGADAAAAEKRPRVADE